MISSKIYLSIFAYMVYTTSETYKGMVISLMPFMQPIFTHIFWPFLCK